MTEKQTAKAPRMYSNAAFGVAIVGLFLYILAFRPVDWLTDGPPGGTPADTGKAHIVRCETNIWELQLIKSCVATVTWANGAQGASTIESSRRLSGDVDVAMYQVKVRTKNGTKDGELVVANGEQFPHINPAWAWIHGFGGPIVILGLVIVAVKISSRLDERSLTNAVKAGWRPPYDGRGPKPGKRQRKLKRARPRRRNR